jgi:lipopolysaccharide exporter
VDEKVFEKDIEFEYKQEESLGRRAVKGGMWLFTLKIAHRVLGFVRTIILARFLSPNDFGLMGVAVLTINMLETFSKTGFEIALVQKKEDIRAYLDSAWTVQLIRSVVLFTLLYFGAPLIAYFFKSPQAVLIIRILAFLELFTGAKNIGTVFFLKELRFDKGFVLQFSGMIVNVAVAIVLAFVLKNVWALVYGSLSGAFVTFIASYVLHPYRPKLRFDFSKVKELFHFGKWLFISSILVFLVTQGDDFFVGKLLGITALGFYQMAYHLSNAAATEISHVVSYVMFPVYSKIQHDMERFRRAYLEILQLVAFITVPVTAVIFLLAPDFTFLFLGEKWMPMVSAMQILAFAGLFRAIAATTGCVLFALGKPRVETTLETVRLIILAALIYPATVKFGIAGTSIAVCLSIGLSLLGFLYSVKKIVQLGTGYLLKAVFYPIVSTVALILAIWLLKRIIPVVDIVRFTAVAAGGFLFYLFVSYVLTKFTDYKIYDVIRQRARMGI